MKHLDNLWIAAACLAALCVVVGLVLVRRTTLPPIRLTVPATQPATQEFKLNNQIPAEFAVEADHCP